MHKGNREHFLTRVMNAGFTKAADSFSKIIHRSVTMVNSQPVLIRHDSDISYLTREQGDLNILITQIIGDFSGKSFLVFNSDESGEIFEALKLSTANDALKEALLLEIDNIISASVIAELANSLRVEIYGDVPKLVKINSKDFLEFVKMEMSSDDPFSMVFCNAIFQLDGNRSVQPQFIWKLSSRVFEMTPTAKTEA
ncbi:MAG TPA: hypothetical protein VGQ59_04660 [Cyclobacteriaceae bacterium]|jgi:chemotaxis protein CheY-P-specific phosphatase CheC|nr:hypothetical protein [Cyclobacteriaceae bacterium]